MITNNMCVFCFCVHVNYKSIGDSRIKITEYGDKVTVTVLAGQYNSIDGVVELKRWVNEKGDGVEYIAVGKLDIDQFIQLSTGQNKTVLWILRIATFFLIFIGSWIVTKFFRPLGMHNYILNFLLFFSHFFVVPFCRNLTILTSPNTFSSIHSTFLIVCQKIK